MSDLESAIALSIAAHRGQVDKGGQPYILHPLRVMLQLESDPERIVAVLHDVVEDNQEYTMSRLESLGYSREILEALDCLTRRPEENYNEFVGRIKLNRLATRVKLADLEDNMDIRRLAGLSTVDYGRLQRYRKVWGELKSL
jgi:(p)ppGpp synthase/HD superfamily hydrolase